MGKYQFTKVGYREAAHKIVSITDKAGGFNSVALVDEKGQFNFCLNYRQREDEQYRLWDFDSLDYHDGIMTHPTEEDLLKLIDAIEKEYIDYRKIDFDEQDNDILDNTENETFCIGDIIVVPQDESNIMRKVKRQVLNVDGDFILACSPEIYNRINRAKKDKASVYSSLGIYLYKKTECEKII